MAINDAVTDEWAKTVCKIGQGAKTCRYLVMGSGGWSCEKLNPNTQRILDIKAMRGDMTAISDNCEGRLSR
jgi:hypothetical protein